MAAPNLEPRSPSVGRERGAQALTRESRPPGALGLDPHRARIVLTASEQHWVGGSVSQRKSKAGCSYIGIPGNHMAEFGSFCTSTVSASRSHQLPKRGNSDATDWTSCALKLRYRGKTEFLAPASGPSPQPLSPVPGSGLQIQIVGGVLLKAGPLGARVAGSSSSRPPFTIGSNASLDYNSRNATGGGNDYAI